MARPKKKSQGFGKSQPRTRDVKDFIVAFGKKKGDEQEVFLTANLERLDESLLETLPLVFQSMVKGKPLSAREDIALIFGNFGNLLCQFSEGSRWLNIELGITAYKSALNGFTRENSAEHWAVLEMNLGNAYRSRILGNRAENLEMAIDFYKSTLGIFTRENFPQDWVSVQRNLGVSYTHRIYGDVAENLEMAIAFYKSALEICTRENIPRKWATIQMNLGNAYCNRIRADRAENLEMAIVFYENALEIFTRQDSPQEWAEVQINLGNAYGARIHGDRSENLEQSIALYENALEIFTREDTPQMWVDIQMNLGATYHERICGDRAENLEQSIALYERASKILKREDFPQTWATIQMNLGAVYSVRIQGSRAENLEMAIALHQSALEVFTYKSFPQNWADVQLNLGTALKQRYELTKVSADLKQALRAYKAAYDAIDPEHYNRAKIWQAMPEVQTILGSRLVRDGEWIQGLELLKAALSQLSPRSRTNPLAYANALYQIGRTHEIMSNWKDARIYYRDALRFYEHIDNKVGMARCHHGLGAILGCQGALVESVAELEQARNLFQHQGLQEEIREIDDLMSLAQEGQQTNTALNVRISA